MYGPRKCMEDTVTQFAEIYVFVTALIGGVSALILCKSLPSVAVHHGATLEDREWKMELPRSTSANCSLVPSNQALRMVGQLSEICVEELQERKYNGPIDGKKGR